MYVLNLPNRPDRLLFMDHKLKALNIKYTPIPAVYGKNHQREYDMYMKQFSKTEIKQKKHINSAGAYGILLSYLTHIAPLCKTKKHIMVMEDDIFFHNDFQTRIQTDMKTFMTFDIVWLGCQQTTWHSYMEESIQEKGYYTTYTKNLSYGIPFGAYCMLFSSRFLDVLFSEMKDAWDTKIIRNIDIFFSYVLEKHKWLTSCCVKPDLVLPQVFESDNMGHRNILDMCQTRKWDLNQYAYETLTSQFSNIYKQFVYTNENTYPSTFYQEMGIEKDVLHRLFENRNREGETQFVFIITSYNNSQWVYKNLKSVIQQKYTFWRIIYVNDCSTDDTLKKVKTCIQEHNVSHCVHIINNNKQMHQSYGRWTAAQLCEDHEICCMLDGDDWLVDDPYVLQKLDALYRKHELKLSYGQFYYYEGDEKNMVLSGKQSYTKDEIQTNTYRHKWISQHLRTISAKLFKRIPKEYLIFKGNWLSCCTDIAEMYWCLEKSCGKHMNVQFPTMVYNKIASMQHKNSFYNRTKYDDENTYRKQVLHYLQNYLQEDV